jgi:hypothetical protein
MSGQTWGLGLTFGLACASATFFLLMRCESKGRAFGPRSRRWALLAVGLTGLLSASGALGLATLGHYVPLAILGIGVAAPSALCLERIREGIPQRRSVYGAAATLWLSWLLVRLDEGMAEDKTEWCELRVDDTWLNDELILAAHFYHDYLEQRLSESERRRYRIHALTHAIEARLDIARLIEAHAARNSIIAAINASRLGREARYQRNLDDLTRLGDRLRHDAERDMKRMLAAAYGSGLYRLERYTPPARGMRETTAEPAGSPRWHP